MIVSKADFAKIYGVSRQAVSSAVKYGKLFETEDRMIDDQDERNIDWVKRRKDIAAEAKKARSSKKKTEKKSPEVEISPEEDEDPGDLSIQKLKADIRAKVVQADLVLLKKTERMGELIERDLVDKLFSRLRAEIDSNLLDLPVRSSERIYALFKSGKKAKDIQKYLEKEIERSIKNIKIGALKELR